MRLNEAQKGHVDLELLKPLLSITQKVMHRWVAFYSSRVIARDFLGFEIFRKTGLSGAEKKITVVIMTKDSPIENRGDGSYWELMR